MNSEIPEVVCDASYELVIKRSSAVQVMNLKVTLEIRQLRPPFLDKKTSLGKIKPNDFTVTKGEEVQRNCCKDSQVAGKSSGTAVSAVQYLIYNLSHVVVPNSTTHI